jgi:hypothetical protein
MFAWFFQLCRTIWHVVRPARPESIDVEDGEEKLWAITLEPHGEEERLVGVIAGTRAEARDVGNSAAGAYVLMSGEVFLGRCGTMELEVHTEALLKATLEAAVPLWIAQLRTRPWADIQARAATAAQVIAEKGDVILYKSKTKGESARAFNALAEGLAILAFAPGGVRAFGLHFEAKHAAE